MKEVGKINIDFYIIETKSPYILSIFDNSDWIYSENLPAYLLVRLPGSSKDKTYSFKKEAINTLNSHNLGLSCLKGDCTEEEYVKLPDGIYTITVQSGYEDVNQTKYYLKTDNIDLEIAKKITLFGFNYSDSNKDKIESIYEVKWLLEVAKSWAKEGDFVKSDRFFQEAIKTFNSQSCG